MLSGLAEFYTSPRMDLATSPLSHFTLPPYLRKSPLDKVGETSFDGRFDDEDDAMFNLVQINPLCNIESRNPRVSSLLRIAKLRVLNSSRSAGCSKLTNSEGT